MDGAAVVKSQGANGRLRDASGIACPAKRPAKDGRAGTQRHGWLLAEDFAICAFTGAAIMDDRTDTPHARPE